MIWGTSRDARRLSWSGKRPAIARLSRVFRGSSSGLVRVSLDDLPLELLDVVAASLTLEDIKALRLTCKRLAFETAKRISSTRLFFSTTKPDIDVFKAIVNHPYLSQIVEEVVWLDYRMFVDVSDFPKPHKKAHDDYVFGYHIGPQERYASPDGMFRREYMKKMVKRYDWFTSRYIEQRTIIESGSDCITLVDGVTKLPNLRRMSLATRENYTHAPVWDRRFRSPFLRAVPFQEETLIHIPTDFDWQTVNRPALEVIRNRARGYHMIVDAMAKRQPALQELFLETSRRLPINEFFRTHEFAVKDMETAWLAFRDLRKLTLLINIEDAHLFGWTSLTNGYLAKALQRASKLEELSISGNEVLYEAARAPFIAILKSENVLDVKRMPNLRLLELANMAFEWDDFIEWVYTLPESLKRLSGTSIALFEGTWNDCWEQWKTRQPSVGEIKVKSGLEVTSNRTPPELQEGILRFFERNWKFAEVLVRAHPTGTGLLIQRMYPDGSLHL